jgi:RNA polymerase sigma factor (sigma-70 family)
MTTPDDLGPQDGDLPRAPDEHQLIFRVQHADTHDSNTAFTQLVEPYIESLLRCARRLVANPADVVQHVLFCAWGRLTGPVPFTLDEGTTFKHYLIRGTRNRALKECERLNRHPDVPLDSLHYVADESSAREMSAEWLDSATQDEVEDYVEELLDRVRARMARAEELDQAAHQSGALADEPEASTQSSPHNRVFWAIAQLSPRQRDALVLATFSELTGDKLTHEEIGRRFGISGKTVSTHVRDARIRLKALLDQRDGGTQSAAHTVEQMRQENAATIDQRATQTTSTTTDKDGKTLHEPDAHEYGR